MNISEFPAIRKGSVPFRDDVNFPRGISRSGVFSISQSEILKIYGDTLRSLEVGVLAPINEAEQNFLSFCDGAKEAESQLEKLWLKYKQEICRSKSFHTAFGHCEKATDELGLDLDDFQQAESH